MRKTISAIALAGALSAGMLLNTKADKPASAAQPLNLQATWELVAATMSCMPNESALPPTEQRKIKMITGGKFVWLQYERASGKLLALAGGSYDLKGAEYTEKLEFASKELESIVGKAFAFKVTVQGDKLRQTGSVGEGIDLDETWQRTGATPSSAVTVGQAGTR